MLSQTNAHPRDARVRFVEETHRYYVDGSTDGYTSVTTLIHSLFGTFDADEVIAKMRRGRNWTSSAYFGKTPEEIKAEWEANRDAAAAAGTLMHASIENFYNGLPHGGGGTREFAMFRRFREDHPDLIPFRTEMVVWSDEIKIAGSVDMLYCDPRSPGSLVLADWKRSKEIKRDNRWQAGTDPLTRHLPDCNLVHYSLQLHVYSYLLQRFYGYAVTEKFLVVLHPAQDDYLRVDALDLSELAAAVLERREAGVRAKTSRYKCED